MMEYVNMLYYFPNIWAQANLRLQYVQKDLLDLLSQDITGGLVPDLLMDVDEMPGLGLGSEGQKHMLQPEIYWQVVGQWGGYITGWDRIYRWIGWYGEWYGLVG